MNYETLREDLKALSVPEIEQLRDDYQRAHPKEGKCVYLCNEVIKDKQERESMKYKVILDGWQETIDYTEISAICESIQKRFSFSAPSFWMIKAFQFGYAYGKAAERAKKKRIHK